MGTMLLLLVESAVGRVRARVRLERRGGDV